MFRTRLPFAGPLEVGLLPGEPGGLISTRAAGSAELQARLSWRSAEDRPDVSPIDELGYLADETAASRQHLRGEQSSCGYIIHGRLGAMTLDALGDGVGSYLRSVSVYAARTGAVLETRVLRTAEPVVPLADSICELARLLVAAGVPVRFGRVWTPLPPGASCGLGVGGIEEIETLLPVDIPPGEVTP